MIENGTDIVTVSEIAGHTDIKMTRRYLHSRPESKRNALESLAVISRIAREKIETKPADEAGIEAERMRKESLPAEVLTASQYEN